MQAGSDPAVLWYALGAAGVILVCAAVFFLIRKYFEKRGSIKEVEAVAAIVPPYDAALNALDDLERNLGRNIRLFYFNLTAVLKKYIGDSFGINAPEMTSAEFVRFIGRLDLGMDIRKRINEFVKSADPFKYAGKVPEKNRAKEDLVCVREIISDIEAQVVRQEEQQ